jgi:hypothetical protein
MKKSDVYEIAIKILGLYILVNIIQQIFEFIIYLFRLISYSAQANESIKEELITFTIGIFGLLLTIFISWLMIFRTKFVVSKICSQNDFEENAKLFAEKKVIYEIAIITMGLLLIGWTLPEFTFKFVVYIGQLKLGESTRISDYNYVMISGLKVLIGVFAILLSKTISTYFGKSKEVNVEHDS